MYNYPPPEGFTLDPVSGMYYLEQQIETASGPMRLITWFNPETGEYTQQMIPPETAPKRKGRGKKPAALAAALAFVTIVVIADTMFDNDDAQQLQSSSATASGSYSPQHKEDWGRFDSASEESLAASAPDVQQEGTASSSSLAVNDPNYEGSEETPDDMEEEAQVWAYYICTTAQGIDYDVDQWFIMTIMTDETVYFRITLADGSTEELTCHAESFPDEWIMRLTVEQTEAAKKLGLTTIEFAYNENLNFLLLTPNVGVGGYGDEYRDAPWMQNQ